MKVLWLVNTVMPELAVHLGGKPSVFGGWLTGAMKAVRESGTEMVICCETPPGQNAGKFEVNGKSYYFVDHETDQLLEEQFRSLIQAEQPDLIHVFGTEYVAVLPFLRAAGPNKTVLTLQGALQCIAQTCLDGIPEHISRDNMLKKLRRSLTKEDAPLQQKQRSFFLRAAREKEAFHLIRYADGCSRWGSAYIHAENPQCKMFECGCFLRDPFYEEPVWDSRKCDRHTVLALMTRPEKGAHMLIQAMQKVVRQHPDARLILAGTHFSYRDYRGIKRRIQNLTPDYFWYIQSLIDRYQLRDHVKFVGYLDADAMKQQLLRCNVFVSPSSHEHLATALGEARILGVPSIATAVGALPEMIDHGKDGYLYDFTEVHVLAQYICSLFENEALAKQFSQLGRQHAMHTYSYERNSRSLIDMYRTILADCREENV